MCPLFLREYENFGGNNYGSFYSSPRSVPRKGALEALKSFTGKKAMICVGGGSMKRFGFLDRAVLT